MIYCVSSDRMTHAYSRRGVIYWIALVRYLNEMVRHATSNDLIIYFREQ